MSKLDADIQKEVEQLGDVPPSRFAQKNCCGLSSVAQFVLVACLGSFQFGYQSSAFNTCKSFVIVDFGWCDAEPGQLLNCTKGIVYGALITSSVFIGLVLGCLLAARITASGRRFGLMFTNFVFLFGSILSASAEGFTTLFISRFIAGVGVGLATVCVPMYISEFTPAASRGFWGTLHQLLITVGIFAGTLLGLAFGTAPENDDIYFEISTFQLAWWRVMMAFPGLISLVAIFLLWIVYPSESPPYLVEQKKTKTAAALLRELLQKEDVKHEIESIERGLCQDSVLRTQSLSLFRAMSFPSYRLVLLLAFFLALFQQFTGINVLVANSNKLYASLKLRGQVITGLTVGMNALNVLMTFPSVLLMDKLGRKTLLCGGVLGQAICMGIAFVANLIKNDSPAVQWLTVGCIYGFIVCFAIGYGPTLWVYLHEIFPPEIKKSGASVASALNGVATIIVVLPSDFIFKEDLSAMLGVFCCASFVAFAVAIIFMKETSGLSIEDSPYFKGKTRIMSKYFTQTGLNEQSAPVASLASGFYSNAQLPVSSQHLVEEA